MCPSLARSLRIETRSGADGKSNRAAKVAFRSLIAWVALSVSAAICSSQDRYLRKPACPLGSLPSAHGCRLESIRRSVHLAITFVRLMGRNCPGFPGFLIATISAIGQVKGVLPSLLERLSSLSKRSLPVCDSSLRNMIWMSSRIRPFFWMTRSSAHFDLFLLLCCCLDSRKVHGCAVLVAMRRVFALVLRLRDALPEKPDGLFPGRGVLRQVWPCLSLQYRARR